MKNLVDRINSWIFWKKHGVIVNRMMDDERTRRSMAAMKGHDTRKRRDLIPTIVTGTECDR